MSIRGAKPYDAGKVRTPIAGPACQLQGPDCKELPWHPDTSGNLWLRFAKPKLPRNLRWFASTPLWRRPAVFTQFLRKMRWPVQGHLFLAPFLALSLGRFRAFVSQRDCCC